MIMGSRVDTKGDKQNLVKLSVYHIFHFTVLIRLTYKNVSKT